MIRQESYDPEICTTQNDVIDALKNKKIVLYLKGEAAAPILKKMKEEMNNVKFGKLLRNLGGLALVLTFFTGGGLILLALGTGAGALMARGELKKYGIGYFKKHGKEIIVFVKVKGIYQYNFYEDRINDTITVSNGKYCPKCKGKKIDKKKGSCSKCGHELVIIHPQ